MNTPRNSKPGCITRRNAIGGSLAAAAMFATASPTFAMGLVPYGESLAYRMSEEHWANMVGENFRIVNFSFEGEEGKIRRTSLRLEETSLVIPKGADEARPDFLRDCAISLLFSGPSKSVLIDASYQVKHPWLGEFDLLLSQTRSKRFNKSKVYEAIINN